MSSTTAQPSPSPARRQPEDRGLSAFRPVRLRKASDEVVAVLIDAMRGGLYLPGDLLPRERDLAARLDVSRDVVREAIETLRRQGIVSSRRGRHGGTVVESLRNLSLVQASLTGETTANLRSLLELRRMIETPAALLASQRGSREDFARLRALVDELVRAGDRPPGENLELDARFHVAVAETARNDALARTVRATLDQILWIRSFFPVGRVELHRASSNQEETLAAIVSGDRERVLRAVDRHLGAFEEVVLGFTLGSPSLETALPAIGRLPIPLRPGGARGAS